MLVCDTSGLIALFDRGDAHHRSVAQVVAAEAGTFVVSPYVVAELDYILATRHGVGAELAALGELCGGAWELAAMDVALLAGAREVVERYADQSVGVADASLVVLAARYSTDRLLTLDRRHFDVVRTLDGGRFTVLPGP